MADDKIIIEAEIKANTKAGADEAVKDVGRIVQADAALEAQEAKTTAAITAASQKQTAVRKAAADAAKASVISAGDGTQISAVANDRVVTSYSSQTRLLNQVERAIDPLARKAKEGGIAIEGLNRIIAGSGPLAGEATAVLDKFQAKIEDLKAVTTGPGGDIIPGLAGQRAVIEQLTDAWIPYAREVRTARDAVEALNDIVKEGGTEAIQAANLMVVAEQKLSEARQNQIKTLTAPTAIATVDPKQQSFIDQQTKSLTPYMAKVREAQAVTIELNKIISQGGPLANDAYKLLAPAQEKVIEAQKQLTDVTNGGISSSKSLGRAINEVSSSHATLSTQAQSAFHALRGFTEQVAAGVPITRAFTLEINNLSYAMSAPGGLPGAFKEILNIFGRFLGPAVGLGAIAGGLLVVGLRINEVQNNLRGFQASLDTIAKGSGQTAQSFQNLIDDFRKVGVASDDTKKSIDEIFKASPQGLNPAFGKQIVQTALDISATASSAGDLPANVQKLTAALTGGTEALEKYGLDLGAITAKEAEFMTELARGGKVSEAALFGLNKISDFFAGTYIRSLSPARQATISLVNAWNSAVNALANSNFANAAVTGLTNLIKKIDDVIPALERIFNWFRDHQDWLGQQIDKLTGGKGLLGNLNLPSVPGFGGSQTTSSNAGVSPLPNQPSVASSQTRFDTRGLDVASESLQRLAVVAAEASKTLPEGYSAIATSTTAGQHTPGSMHYQAGAMDIRIVGPEGPVSNKGADTNNLYTNFAADAYLANQRLFPGTNLASGINFGVTPGSNVADLMHLDVGQQRGNLGTPLPQVAAARAQQLQQTVAGVVPATGTAVSATAADQQALLKQNELLNKSVQDQTRIYTDNLAVQKQLPIQQQIEQARLEAIRNELAKGTSQQDAALFGQKAAEAEAAKLGVEWDKQARIAGDLATGTLKTADAYQENEVAGLKSAAATEAHNTALTAAVPENQIYNQIINKNATDAIAGASKEQAAFNVTLAANARLVKGAEEGTAAEQRAQIQNEAVTATQDALNHAKVTGNEILIQRAQRLQQEKIAQLEANTAATQTLDLERSTTRLRNEVDQTKLQAGLSVQGATTQEIARQVELLQARVHVEQDDSFATEKSKANYLAIVDASTKWKVQLSLIEQEQQRINDTIINIANTISGTLTQAISDAFDGTKPKAWADRIKTLLKEIVTSLSENQFIKPLLGTIASALGFGQAGQQLGTFGGNTATGAVGIPGTGTLGQIGGLANNLTGGGGGIFGNLFGGNGGTSSISEFFNSTLGGALGFATPLNGAPFSSTIAGPGAPGAIAEGSLFGSTTLTGALGGLGAGIGAGGLISSLLGGSPTTGSIGGAIGGLAGNLLLPGLGGILGGALGGLTGLFGNNKPSNNPAANDLNLISGQTSRNVSSPDAASNQNVQQITQTLQAFTKQLTQIIGKPLSLQNTTVDIQSGVRDGIKLGFGGSTRAFSDSASAINAVELDIAHGLTNLSDSMTTVLAHITDPAQIQDAITFALQYDRLKTAADSAFSSISTDTAKIGPFEAALVSIQGTFDDLTSKANQFGLALGPINAGLQEATRRLQTDFGTALDQALNTASAQDFINQLQAVGDAFRSNTREASAIGLGGDIPTATKISQVEVAKAREILSQLTPAQLTQVANQLQDTYPELSELARTIVGIGGAAGTAANALEDLTNGIKSVSDLAKSLTIGPLAGLTAAQQVTANVGQFNKDVSTARQAGPNITSEQLANVTTSGQAAIEASQTAYGNAPATADIRRQIVQDLNSILAIANTAQVSRTSATSTAANAANAEVGSAADQANRPLSVIIAQNAVRANPVSVTTNVPAVAAAASPMQQAVATSAPAPAQAAPTPAASTEASSGAHTKGDIYYLTADENGAYVNLKDIGYASGTVGNWSMANDNRSSHIAKYASGTPIVSLAGDSHVASYASGTSHETSIASMAGDSHVASYASGTSHETSIASMAGDSHVASYASGTSHETSIASMAGNSHVASYASGTSHETSIASMAGNSHVASYASGTSHETSIASMAGDSHVASYASGTSHETSIASMAGDSHVASYASGISHETSIASMAGDSHVASYASGTSHETSIASMAGDSHVASYASGVMNAVNDNHKMMSWSEHNWSQSMTHAASYAMGTAMLPPGYATGTVAGKILVGERGPEWMMPGGGNHEWMQVGKSGPEIIDQSGGAIILPFPVHPKDVQLAGSAMDKIGMMPAYATGTDDFGLIPAPPAVVDSPDVGINVSHSSSSMEGVLSELRALRIENRGLREEVGAVKKQLQGGQVQAMQDARMGNSRLSSIDIKLGTGAMAPVRRAVG